MYSGDRFKTRRSLSDKCRVHDMTRGQRQICVCVVERVTN